MAYLEQFVQVESVLTYLFVGSGTFAFQITLFDAFSAVSVVIFRDFSEFDEQTGIWLSGLFCWWVLFRAACRLCLC